MRSLVSNSPGFGKAATSALQANSDALTKLVTSSYGASLGEQFKLLWQKHITDLVSYAKAVAGHDDSAKGAARGALSADAEAYGAWFAAASQGRIHASDAVAGVRMHINDLTSQIDAYAARDYDTAYRIEREAYEHMFDAGTTFVKASVTPELAVAFDAPPERLRSAFSMLLGEHMELLTDAQRATFASPAEFKAAAAQVDANTVALAKGLGAIVGPKKAAEFQEDWANHVDGLISYTSAVAANNGSAKSAAEKGLSVFAFKLALYFRGIVKNQLAVGPLAGAITMHDSHLTDQVDAYAAKDYDKAQQLELDGYDQMLGVANTLVDSIQRTVSSTLPVGGVKTGGGGTARRPR
jgi:hypothetical protein